MRRTGRPARRRLARRPQRGRAGAGGGGAGAVARLSDPDRPPVRCPRPGRLCHRGLVPGGAGPDGGGRIRPRPACGTWPPTAPTATPSGSPRRWRRRCGCRWARPPSSPWAVAGRPGDRPPDRRPRGHLHPAGDGAGHPALRPAGGAGRRHAGGAHQPGAPGGAGDRRTAAAGHGRAAGLRRWAPGCAGWRWRTPWPSSARAGGGGGRAAGAGTGDVAAGAARAGPPGSSASRFRWGCPR